ncbi:uncharacterized protein [Clytia hemisphaerica]|uniref:uncharacterized protein isoform X1 n=1 Tax=Clytia hemisphaerica TaxID=252671 RepID=UPI0034D54AA7
MVKDNILWFVLAIILLRTIGFVDAIFFPPGTCFLAGRQIQKHQSVNISHCTECFCKGDRSIECKTRHLNGSLETLCTNCMDMPSPSCSFCQQDIPKNKSFPVDVGAGDCISCNCSSDGINCQYFNQFLCTGDLSCGLELVTYSSCHICLDPLDGSRKQNGEFWKTADGIDCSCLDGNNQCFKPVEVEDMFLIIECRQCTPWKYQQTFHQPKDCSFNENVMTHNSVSHLQIYNVHHCFDCACYMGNYLCVTEGSYKFGKIPIFFKHGCHNEMKCNELLLNENVRNYCAGNPLESQCKGNYEWNTPGCKLICNETLVNPNHVVIDQWCDLLKISKSCEACPMSEDEFVAKFGHLVIMCNATGQYIWKDQICDGKEDCVNSEDETNCKEYYCRYDQDRFGYIWPTTQVNTQKNISCKDAVITLKDNFTKIEGLTGNFTRKCELNVNGASMERTECACSSLMPLPKLTFRDINSTYQSVLQDVEVVYQHVLSSPTNEWHYQQMYRLMNITLKKLILDSLNGGHNEKWKNKTAPIIVLIMETCSAIRKKYSFCPYENEEEIDAMDHIAHHILNFDIFRSFRIQFNPFVTSLVKALGAEFFFEKRLSLMKNEDFDQRRKNSLSIYGVGNHNGSDITLGNSGMKDNLNTVGQSNHERKTDLDMLEEVISAINIAALVLGLIIFRIIRKNTLKIFIHQNLMLSFLLKAITYKIPLWFVEDLETKSNAGCFAVSILSYFFTLSTFSWMMVEGINIIIIVVFVFKGNRNYHKQYLAIGYGFPIVMTGTFVAIFHQQFKDAIKCTILDGVYQWLLRGPMTFILVINLVFFILILAKIRKSAVKRKSMVSRSTSAENKSSPKTFLVLVPLLGIPFILAPFVEYNIYIAYTFVIMNGLTGVYIFVGHVILDESITKDLRKRYFEPAKGKFFGVSCLCFDKRTKENSSNKPNTAESSSENKCQDSEVNKREGNHANTEK